MAEAEELRVEIVEGVIANFKADVVVNSTNRGLQLNTGALSKSFLNAAGQAIQDECDKNYPQGVDLGKLASTGGHKLLSKRVYHGALPAWDSKERNVNPSELLCEFVCACLEQAHTDGATSIAFPTLGCGFLNYPHHEVAMTMCQCIAIFKSIHEDTCLRVITVVIYPKGQDWKHIKQSFMRELGLARVHRGERDGYARPKRFSAVKIAADRAGRCENRLAHLRLRRKEGDQKLKRAPQHGDSYAITTELEGSVAFLDTCHREQAHNSCKQILKCGHICPGVKNEQRCPPCIQNDCPGRGDLKQSAGDNCTICYTDVLSAAPVIQLTCGHMYHHHCVKRMLVNKWVGARITFNFMNCPMCKKVMKQPLLDEKLKPLKALQDDVRRKAMMRLQYEGLDKCPEVTSRDSPFFRKPEDFAMDRYCYYHCYKCKQAYFGGTAQCDQGDGDREFETKDLICPSCSNPDPKQVCQSHNTDYLEYKCRYCCSVAVFFCFGTTHFCNACHDDAVRLSIMPVNNLPGCPAGPCGKQLRGKCPLKVKHPPTGTEFSLGCGICAHLSSF